MHKLCLPVGVNLGLFLCGCHATERQSVRSLIVNERASSSPMTLNRRTCLENWRLNITWCNYLSPRVNVMLRLYPLKKSFPMVWSVSVYCRVCLFVCSYASGYEGGDRINICGCDWEIPSLADELRSGISGRDFAGGSYHSSWETARGGGGG